MEKVVPLYKTGYKRHSKLQTKSAVICFFSKLLEKLVYNRLMAFIERSGFSAEAQQGFRTKK